MGEYDLRKERKKKSAIEGNHGFDIESSSSLSFAYIEKLINIENREKQNITP